MANEVQFKIDPKDEQGCYANVVSVHQTANEVIIDFGYVVPGSDPTTVKVVSRVNLSKNNAENFAKSLTDTLSKKVETDKK